MGNILFKLKSHLAIVIAAILGVVVVAGGIYLLTSKSSTTTTASAGGVNSPTTTIASHLVSTTTTAVPALNPTGACLTAVNAMKAFISANPASKGSPSGVELSQYQPIYQKILQNCSTTQSDAVIGHIVQPWLTAAAKVSADSTTTSTTLAPGTETTQG
jgi:hypothetical protein